MVNRSRRVSLVVLASLLVVQTSGALFAADWGWLNITHLWKGTPVDVHPPQACQNCDNPYCIERLPVTECVTGEKRNDNVCVRYEYVSVPEVRYRWQIKCISKEIPCTGCKTVCEDRDIEHRYSVERWDKQQLACSERHCKTCVPQSELLPGKVCKTEPGETIIKAKYWSCVKVPYTVFRQVKREVCVKQPCYEKVPVTVTRFVCEHCGGLGCKVCKP